MHLFRSLKSPKPLFRGLSAWSHLRAVHAKDAPLDIHPEVEDALSNHKPVVALETALVTHGLPYPSSLEVPLSLEGIVRSTGAIPATIGIIDGRVKVGLERYELERLAERKNKPSKISRRDIAAAIATEVDGGTFCRVLLLWCKLSHSEIFRNYLQRNSHILCLGWNQGLLDHFQLELNSSLQKLDRSLLQAGKSEVFSGLDCFNHVQARGCASRW